MCQAQKVFGQWLYYKEQRYDWGVCEVPKALQKGGPKFQVEGGFGPSQVEMVGANVPEAAECRAGSETLCGWIWPDMKREPTESVQKWDEEDARSTCTWSRAPAKDLHSIHGEPLELFSLFKLSYWSSASYVVVIEIHST